MKTQSVFETVYQPENHRSSRRRVGVLLTWALSISLFSIPDVRASWESVFATYPPGCATVPDVQTALYGENSVKFFEGRLALVNARNTSEKLDAIVAAYRVGCADSNRSVIWLSFSIPPELSSSTLYQMPAIAFRFSNGWGRYVSLLREPGGAAVTERYLPVIGNTDEYAALAGSSRTWVYILDQDYAAAYWDGPISPEQYNGSFKLQFDALDSTGSMRLFEVSVPSTSEALSANTSIPLNGRLSGNWVMDGAADQGIMLAVSELVPGVMPAPDEIAQSELLMFLSWYTFDVHGKPLWLTGSAQFLPGETEVSLLLDLVSQGQFLGGNGGQRIRAGSLSLRAVSCGQIDVDYDLSAVGLGSGSTKLKRLFSLEISDFSCSDKSNLQGEDS